MENQRYDNETSSETVKPSLADYSRKSLVGAAYRVGASFTMDALYLTAASTLAYYCTKDREFVNSAMTAASDFFQNLDPAKLGRVAGFVVAINFVDYKFDVTNRLDRLVKSGMDKLRKINK